MSFAYDDVTHSYTLDGLPIQSMTDMLKELGFYQVEYIPDFYKERGTALHDIMKLLLFKELNEQALYQDAMDGHADLTPWLRGMKNFIKNHKPEWHTLQGQPVVELPLYHTVLNYGFTADFYGSIILDQDKSDHLFDWKFWGSITKASMTAAGIQTAGYVEGLMSHIPIDRPQRGVVHFSDKLKHGYSIHHCEEETDYIDFTSVRNVCARKRSCGL